MGSIIPFLLRRYSSLGKFTEFGRARSTRRATGVMMKTEVGDPSACRVPCFFFSRYTTKKTQSSFDENGVMNAWHMRYWYGCIIHSVPRLGGRPRTWAQGEGHAGQSSTTRHEKVQNVRSKINLISDHKSDKSSKFNLVHKKTFVKIMHK